MLSKKFSNKKLFSDFQTILNSSIESIKPSKLIKEHVKVVRRNENDYLKISNDLLFPNQNLHVLNRFQEFELNKNVHVAAFGKASLGVYILRCYFNLQNLNSIYALRYKECLFK